MPDSRDNAVSLSTLPPDHSPLPTGSSNILSGFLEPIENSVCTTVIYSPRAASQTVADLLQSDTESLDPNASLPQAATDWSTGERSSTLPQKLHWISDRMYDGSDIHPNPGRLADTNS
jgi:hypothetical protein